MLELPISCIERYELSRQLMWEALKPAELDFEALIKEAKQKLTCRD